VEPLTRRQVFEAVSYAGKDIICARIALCCRGGALVAIDTGFMGPNYSISTACATANYAFVAAANHIRKGEATVMLVGGSEAPIIPVGVGGFVACR
jgi:3-oxoacyl-[acyl-carrier-protein] synthase II